MKWSPTYVAIMKLKKSEVDACKELYPRIWQTFCPLFEVILEDEYDDDVELASIYDRATQRVKNASPQPSSRVMLDFDRLETQAVFVGGLNRIQTTLEGCSEDGRAIIPVASLETRGEVLQGIRAFLAEDAERQAAIRFYTAEFSEDIEARLDNLVRLLGLPRDQIHLIVDQEYFSESQAPAMIATTTIVLRELDHLEAWASVTLAGTSYPEVLSVGGNTISQLPRSEYLLWRQVAARLRDDLAKLGFGDYTITNPILVEYDPTKMRMSGKLIYTADEYWIVLKGRNIRQHGFPQMQQMCVQVLGMQEYCQENFSAGDQRIQDTAEGRASTGNAATWKFVGINHHISFVTQQLG